MRRVLLASAAFLGLAAGACGSSNGDCDKACRNYFTLHYWDDADRELARTPPDKRDALRQDKVEKLEPRMVGELGKCVTDCRQASSDEETKCMIAAKTVKDIEACVPPGQE
jgi:hypothetical protein